jgi:hypothetical protein
MASFWRSASFMLMGNKHFTKHGYARASKSFDNRCVAYERSAAHPAAEETRQQCSLGITRCFRTKRLLRARKNLQACRTSGFTPVAVQVLESSTAVAVPLLLLLLVLMLLLTPAAAWSVRLLAASAL